MKLQCLLVDDEPEALDILESYIKLVDTLELVTTCENAIQAFSVLQEKKVDLILLDIKMPILQGTDFLRSLRNPPKVIFTTAYREYAMDGFELDVVDYLLKPIPLERFLKAIAKVTKTEHLPSPPPANQPVTHSQEAFLYFRSDRKMVKVLTSEILYVESLKDFIKVVTTTAKPLIVKQSISSLEEMLPNSHFIRVHRSYLIAIDKVKTYSATHIQIAGQEIPIGRLFQKDVERALRVC
jgi:DNA-binding LytR/AlgR family response regulator